MIFKKKKIDNCLVLADMVLFVMITRDQITEQTAFTDRPSWESDEPLYEQAPVLRGGDDNLPNYGSR